MLTRKHSIMNRIYRSSPLIVALIYLVIGGLWILFSDRVLAGLIDDPRALTTLQTYKGWFYVVTTAYLAYLLVSWSEENLRGLLNQLNERNGRLRAEIRNRIEKEKRIEQLMDDLAEKNRELESIIYASSHDLRSPLINIQGFRGELSGSLERLHALVDDLPQAGSEEIRTLLDKDIPESMAYIQQGADRLDLLLKGLLTFCRLGSQPMHIETVDAGELMRRVLEERREQIDQARADVIVGPLLPCRADRDHLAQVFTALIDNALKYRRPDRPPQVTIESEARDGRVVYCVKDDGLGIDPQYQESIFRMYYQLDPSQGGQGLGLTIARRILTRMNGRITLTSDPGQGTRFRITLPADNQG